MHCTGGDDAQLSMVKRPYSDIGLRIDGYYYKFNNNRTSVIIYFLYQTGIIQGGTTVQLANLSETEKWFKDGTFYQGSISYKIDWGIFNIDSSLIKFETWNPPDGGGPLITRTNSGEILNDTTFHITKAWESDGDIYNNIDDTYHFKQFSPKPDSACPFIP